MNMTLKTMAIALATSMLGAGVAASAHAAAQIHVSLWDKLTDTPMVTGLAYGTPDADMSRAPMGITATPNLARAGEITFNATNDSKYMIHEMIVIQITDPGKPLPYDETTSRVDEEAVIDKGEISELDPGGSGSLTLTLPAGHYLLICNVPGHFDSGMWTELTVNPQSTASN